MLPINRPRRERAGQVLVIFVSGFFALIGGTPSWWTAAM